MGPACRMMVGHNVYIFGPRWELPIDLVPTEQVDLAQASSFWSESMLEVMKLIAGSFESQYTNILFHHGVIDDRPRDSFFAVDMII